MWCLIRGRLAVVAAMCLAFTVGFAGACDSSVDRRTRDSGIEMWANPSVNGGWTIAFAGIRGYASDVVVRFGDEREETYRRPTFELPSDIEGPIDIWLLEYKLRGVTHSGPYKFRFDPEEAHVKNAKDALDMLRSQWVSWRRYPEDTDLLYTTFLVSHACGIDHVDYGFGAEPDQRLKLADCGVSLSDADTYLRFPANQHSHVVVRITFADGEQTPVRRFPNPDFSEGEARPNGASEEEEERRAQRPAPPEEPEEPEEPEASPVPLPEPGPTAGPDEDGDAESPPVVLTYADAAKVLEPCWRMLLDDLPMRTGTRCAGAYDLVLHVLGDDEDGLADVFRQAADVGRAWGDADAELSTKPAPGDAARKKIAQRKREANRREDALLPRRTAALMGFARKTLEETGGDGDCGRKQTLVLHALEALSVEFREASAKSVTNLSGLGAAAEHARGSLRRANEACTSHADEPGDSRFRKSAKKMVSDSLKLGSARREHSRCVEGDLVEVCARPGGLDSHLRVVLVDAIRMVAGR